MRARQEYVALTSRKINGVWAWFEGDDITQSQVDNLSLVVGVDVKPADPNAVPRPNWDADRPQWEAYAIGQGLDIKEAQNLTRDELRNRYPDEVQDGTKPVRLRPAKSASKSDWVEHVVGLGVPRQEAEAMTKEQLYDRAGVGDDTVNVPADPDVPVDDEPDADQADQK